jgi:hypothetical protein
MTLLVKGLPCVYASASCTARTNTFVQAADKITVTLPSSGVSGGDRVVVKSGGEYAVVAGVEGASSTYLVGQETAEFYRDSVSNVWSVGYRDHMSYTLVKRITYTDINTSIYVHLGYVANVVVREVRYRVITAFSPTNLNTQQFAVREIVLPISEPMTDNLFLGLGTMLAGASSYNYASPTSGYGHGYPSLSLLSFTPFGGYDQMHTREIASVSDAGSGRVTMVTRVGADIIYTNDRISIVNTTNYNGNYVVYSGNGGYTFQLTKTYVAETFAVGDKKFIIGPLKSGSVLTAGELEIYVRVSRKSKL